MSSRCPGSCVALAALALGLGACDREERHSRSKPIGETLPAGANSERDPRAAAYANNAPAIAEGQQLFVWMNCVGCHAHGGGGMGPPLMDEEWRYGGRLDQIVATIAHGRPNGMPSWKGRLTEDQMWKLAAYVRSLSGQPRKDALAGRADSMSSTAPLTLTPREPVVADDGVEP